MNKFHASAFSSHSRWLVLVALIGVLAACSGKAKPVNTPTAPPVAASAAPVAAATATFTPQPTATATPQPTAPPTPTPTVTPTPTSLLTIDYLRQQNYPGSQLVIEDTFTPGSNYDRYYASYYSEGLKQYGLLTIPRGQKPTTGWPVIIFNHGYIPPSQYKTTERYVAYLDGFARSGYIVFRADYRGHDQSEGRASGAYGSPDYIIDVLNAVATLKQYPDADPTRIGMWGHSMGGWITLRAMVTDPDIKAGVIWGGVVGSYEDLLTKWRRGTRPAPTPNPNGSPTRWRNSLSLLYGSPQTNPSFWQSISANYFLEDLSGPIQLHHTMGDEEVPVEFSQILYEQGQEAGMPIELVTYPGDDHDITANFDRAMSQSVAFFDRWLRQPINLADASGPTVFTGSGLANLRAGPGTSFSVVGQMQAGDSLPIIGSNVDRTWWQVQSAQGPAWVSNIVVLAAHYATVPVVEEVAGP